LLRAACTVLNTSVTAVSLHHVTHVQTFGNNLGDSARFRLANDRIDRALLASGSGVSGAPQERRTLCITTARLEIGVRARGEFVG
jgi:hypothetical protein